ncbi:Rieske (2Fe-2S) protein [Deinococcus metallilatus]|uniref:Rieske (2Fe-2S) protein n=1 Tax=Deinococcus metallilatus TaxID=1211322 RepID=A0AAJ5K0Q0_9DEIO|nr:Rieske (2Fe-2S) protein [Deinococcus metallilatus]MBB5294502.1 Rieske Fe-S protein [Deinococcus metallilatus]QBY07552.1 Rieske (2Fe-2S) protein [Deinococcus metallilatus]RXJ13968.1 Rieske (2Fe-2S) protein [Deinococcus metallilatus]TLK29933.1 Rieske (2Fe-2S) protein [Deinococcus metallilatus]GMA15717.1 (2Fe-2S)-binding protein [Deinococcus metallilatus]
MTEKPITASPMTEMPSRRSFIKLVAVTGAAVTLGGRVAAQTASSPAKSGDLLVYQDGPQKGQVVKVADLKEGAAVWAQAVDPATKKPRDAMKSGVVIVRLKPSEIKASSQKNAVNGVVAYSSVCTHQGCPAKEIGSIGQGKGNIICTCHGSIYDPRDNATVLGGPAPRRLPALPLKTDAAGELVAAGEFTGKIGPK